ncbi:MAG: hypothetical protein CVU61_02250 [Deltaproteobacteria bacterium HGW-Deltaproteobacteria-19]|jgi:hypothetical protein|nr:MAG: hypothetical protein CVU61_02250 [Deltaproteobacteria bacterium HGW-Deltaproteobacteria-19]
MFRFLMPFLVTFALTAGAVIFMSLVPLGPPPLPHTLIFLGVVLVSLLVFYLNARFMLKRDPEQERRLINGTVAKAEVLAIEDTGLTMNNDPMVALTLHVKPEYGSSFQVKANTLVSRVSIPRPGDVINVRFDPENPQKLIVV